MTDGGEIDDPTSADAFEAYWRDRDARAADLHDQMARSWEWLLSAEPRDDYGTKFVVGPD